MMQMLAAGGVPPLTDAQRAPDASNPRGYLELEAVKRLKTDKSWLPDARGKAVKVIHLLLPELAEADWEFRVIMMRRPVEEIVASQRAMLARLGRQRQRCPTRSWASCSPTSWSGPNAGWRASPVSRR